MECRSDEAAIWGDLWAGLVNENRGWDLRDTIGHALGCATNIGSAAAIGASGQGASFFSGRQLSSG